GEAETADLATVHRVDVIQNGTIWGGILVESAAPLPAYLAADPEIVPNDEIGTDAGINAAGERLRRMVGLREIEVIDRCGMNGIEPEFRVGPLRMQGRCHQDSETQRPQPRQLSHGFLQITNSIRTAARFRRNASLH